MTIKNYSEFLSNINEGLIKTYPMLKAVKFLKKLLTYNRYEYSIDNDIDSIFIKFININLNKSSIDQIVQLINSCGYFISLIRFYDKKDFEIKTIKPNYNKDYNLIYDDVLNINSYYIQFEVEAKYNYSTVSKKYLYHLTEGKFLHKILSQGLVPKGLNKLSLHLDRIYLADNKQVAVNLITQFNYTNPILLKVNVEGIKLYNDPDYENGYYTTENISPDKIEVVKI